MKKDMTAETSRQEKKPFIRRMLTSKLFLIAVCSVLVYTLAGFFLLPYILKSQLKKYVAEDLNRTLQIEEIRLNPYALTLDISGLALNEADGEGILAFKRFFVNFETKSLFRWAWTFADISLDGLVLQVDVAPDKSVNLDRLVRDLSPESPHAAPPEPATDAPLPRLYFERIQVSNGYIRIRDRSLPTPAEMPIEPINLEITHLSTLPEEKGPHKITARLPGDGILVWSGEISLDPIWSEGQFKMENLHTKLAWNFLKQTLKIDAPEGILGLEGHYLFDYTAKAPEIKISDLTMQLDKLNLKVLDTPNAELAINAIRVDNGRFDLAKNDLAVGRLTLSGGNLQAAVEEDGRLSWENILVEKPNEKPAQVSKTATDNATPFKIHMENIQLKDMGIKFEDQSRLNPISMDLESLGLSLKAEAEISGKETNAIISEMGMDVNSLVVRQVGEAEDLLTFPRTTIKGGQVDLAARRISVGEISIQGGDAAVWRTPKGAINMVQLTASENEGAIRREIGKAKTTAEEEQHPWSVHLGTIRMAAFGVQLSDRSLKDPKRYQLKNINLQVTDFETPPKEPFDFDLALDVAEGGNAEIEGRVDMKTLGVTLNIKADDVALTPLKPYLKEFLIPTLESGSLFLKGDVAYHKDKGTEDALTFKGGGGIKKLALIRPETGKTFLSWNLLDIKGIQFNTLPSALKVETVILDHLVGQFKIQKDGSLNVKDVMVSDRKPSAEAPPLKEKNKVSNKEPSETFPVDVNQVRIRNAEVDFADLSLLPPFAAKILKLNGAVNGFSSAPDRKITMALEGQVDQYGSVNIKGELEPLNTKAYSDVKMIFRNVEMTRLTPYSAKFAGRKIDSGKISLDLDYHVVDGRLKGENEIIVDSLKLGERVENPDATHLPLDLAIALLKDANDRIQLGLPVAGSLDDPEFSYGHLIWKALVNVLSKIVTAPFRALASLVGGDEEDLGTVKFEVGKSRITPPEKEKLAKLAAAMKQRPQLAVEVQGQYAPEADGAALKYLAVRQALAKRMGETDITETNLSTEPLNLTDPLTRKALDGMAAEMMKATELAALKESYGLTPPQPEKTEKTAKKSEPKAPLKPKKPDPDGFYKALFEALVKQQPLPENALAALAEKRAEAVVLELSTVGGVPLNQLKSIPSAGDGQAEKDTVTIKLKLTAREK